MRRLYLIRHASPRIQPAVPTREWPLSERGVEEAQEIARAAVTWGLRAVYSSFEPKARATAAIVGDAVHEPVRIVEGFEELRIDHWIGNADELNALVRAILDQPDASIRGAEAAADAAERFARGIAIVAQGPFPAAVVSHGRGLGAYLARLLEIESPYDFWRSIPMPGWACLSLNSPPPRLLEPFQHSPA